MKGQPNGEAMQNCGNLYLDSKKWNDYYCDSTKNCAICNKPLNIRFTLRGIFELFLTAVLRYLLCKKNEPELSLHFLVTSYDEQGHIYKRKIIRGADLEKTYI